MTTKVSERELAILNCLMKNQRPHEVSARTGEDIGTLYAILRRMIYLCIIEKTGVSSYKVLETNFEVVDETALHRIRFSKKVDPVIDHIHPVFPIEVTDAIRNRIEDYYTRNKHQFIHRSQLADQLGIRKYQLNQEVMNMGLEQKAREEEDYEPMPSM